MNNAIAVKEKANTVRAALEKMQPQFANALEGTGITPARLLRVAMTAIQNTPKLLDCDRQSLYSAVMACAQLGLEPDGILGQAYLIPFGSKVQFIPGYKGLLSLARRSGDVTSIIAKEVYENDLEWDVDYSILPPAPPFRHKPLLKGKRGEIVAVWALARFTDGSFHWDYMTREEVDAIRDNSQGYQAAKRFAKNGEINSPWVSSYPEMAKKTVIRRIAKYLPMSVQKAAFVDERADAGKSTAFDTETGEVITGEAVEIIENEEDGGDDTPPAGGSKLDAFAGQAEPAAEPQPAAIATPPAQPTGQSPAAETPQGMQPIPVPRLKPAKEPQPQTDAVTGEVLPPQAKGITVPKIDLKNYVMNTVAGINFAAQELEKILKAEPIHAMRCEIWTQSEGDRLVAALNEKGLGATSSSLRKLVA